jgi:hypothetical protein
MLLLVALEHVGAFSLWMTEVHTHFAVDCIMLLLAASEHVGAFSLWRAGWLEV